MNLSDYLKSPEFAKEVMASYHNMVESGAFLPSLRKKTVSHNQRIILPILDPVLAADVVIEDILDADHIG